MIILFAMRKLPKLVNLPQKEKVLSSVSDSLHNPKSVSLMCPPESRSILIREEYNYHKANFCWLFITNFSGFKSR